MRLVRNNDPASPRSAAEHTVTTPLLRSHDELAIEVVRELRAELPAASTETIERIAVVECARAIAIAAARAVPVALARVERAADEVVAANDAYDAAGVAAIKAFEVFTHAHHIASDVRSEKCPWCNGAFEAADLALKACTARRGPQRRSE